MFVLSRTTGELVTGGEAGNQHLRKRSWCDAEAREVQPGFEADPEASDEQLATLERIRVAAGQTT